MERLDINEINRCRSAAFRATRVYPGPVGELISRELLAYEDFGYRFGSRTIMMNLVDHVMNLPVSSERAA
jgi:hypothetical protein